MKLLLIEDEKDLTKTLKKGLKEAGYNVDVAYDGIMLMVEFLVDGNELTC